METSELAEAAFAEHNWLRVCTLLRDSPKLAEWDRALEMLATAAWWLDDVDAAIEAREQLFGCAASRGDGGCRGGRHRLAWDSTIGRREAGRSPEAGRRARARCSTASALGRPRLAAAVGGDAGRRRVGTSSARPGGWPRPSAR